MLLLIDLFGVRRGDITSRALLLARFGWGDLAVGGALFDRACAPLTLAVSRREGD